MSIPAKQYRDAATPTEIQSTKISGRVPSRQKHHVRRAFFEDPADTSGMRSPKIPAAHIGSLVVVGDDAEAIAVGNRRVPTKRHAEADTLLFRRRHGCIE